MGYQQAQATLCGSPRCSCIRGLIRFTERGQGCVVEVKACGLPAMPGRAPTFFRLRIEEGGCCPPGQRYDLFPTNGGQVNGCCRPRGCRTEELLPLLATCGEAAMTFYTGAFCVDEIVGKSVTISMDQDDCRFSSGDRAGTQIACGVIQPIQAPCCPRCSW